MKLFTKKQLDEFTKNIIAKEVEELVNEKMKDIVQDIEANMYDETLDKLTFNESEEALLADMHQGGGFYRYLNYLKFIMVSKSLRISDRYEIAKRAGFLDCIDIISSSMASASASQVKKK